MFNKLLLMITVCLLPKSQGNHVLQVENAGEEVCLPSLNDKKNLQFSSLRETFFHNTSPLICEPPASSQSKRGTLTCGHGGLPRA